MYIYSPKKYHSPPRRSIPTPRTHEFFSDSRNVSISLIEGLSRGKRVNSIYSQPALRWTGRGVGGEGVPQSPGCVQSPLPEVAFSLKRRGGGWPRCAIRLELCLPPLQTCFPSYVCIGVSLSLPYSWPNTKFQQIGRWVLC